MITLQGDDESVYVEEQELFVEIRSLKKIIGGKLYETIVDYDGAYTVQVPNIGVLKGLHGGMLATLVEPHQVDLEGTEEDKEVFAMMKASHVEEACAVLRSDSVPALSSAEQLTYAKFLKVRAHAQPCAKFRSCKSPY